MCILNEWVKHLSLGPLCRVCVCSDIFSFLNFFRSPPNTEIHRTARQAAHSSLHCVLSCPGYLGRLYLCTYMLNLLRAGRLSLLGCAVRFVGMNIFQECVWEFGGGVNAEWMEFVRADFSYIIMYSRTVMVCMLCALCDIAARQRASTLLRTQKMCARAFYSDNFFRVRLLLLLSMGGKICAEFLSDCTLWHLHSLCARTRGVEHKSWHFGENVCGVWSIRAFACVLAGVCACFCIAGVNVTGTTDCAAHFCFLLTVHL